MDLNITFFGAFFAGLISFVSPCVLPLVPPYLCFLAGVSFEELSTSQNTTATRARIVLSSIFFVLGFATVFVALGATASSIGQLVTEYLDSLAVVAGALIFVMGLHFTGLLRLSLLYQEARVHVERKPVGPLGAYAVGLAFAFGWTPCVGPVLAAILFAAGAQDSVGQGAMLLAAYAGGIGIPFILAAVFAGAFLGALQRFRKHLGTVEKVMGVLLMITGVLFMFGQMRHIATFLLETFPSLGQFG
ncbi:MAG: cytochrome c biogenesis protein CcdA [Pseudomonadota bacterium]